LFTGNKSVPPSAVRASAGCARLSTGQGFPSAARVLHHPAGETRVDIERGIAVPHLFGPIVRALFTGNKSVPPSAVRASAGCARLSTGQGFPSAARVLNLPAGEASVDIEWGIAGSARFGSSNLDVRHARATLLFLRATTGRVAGATRPLGHAADLVGLDARADVFGNDARAAGPLARVIVTTGLLPVGRARVGLRAGA